jgi:hypothetical protein
VREFFGQNGERPWNGKLVTCGFSTTRPPSRVGASSKAGAIQTSLSFQTQCLCDLAPASIE